MARFRIEATWHDDRVDLCFERCVRLEPDHAARLRARGMLGPDDDAMASTPIGEMAVTEPRKMTPKRVRRAGLDWLAEHAGMIADDSFELQIAVQGDLEALTRLEESFTT